MPKIPPFWAAVLAFTLWTIPAGAAMSDKEKAELAPVVAGSKVTLEQGLVTSLKIKDGSKYFEVIVDQNSGEIAKAEPITGGDDLAEAKKQNDGMFRATRELREAVREAKHDNPGYNAVSVWSEMKDNHSVATVTLVKNSDWKTAVIDLTVYKPLLKQ